MKMPTLNQARDAIVALGRLSGHSAEIDAAAGLVDIVVDLFDKPHEQAELKGAYAEAKARTDAALDRLDAAIADRQARG